MLMMNDPAVFVHERRRRLGDKRYAEQSFKGHGRIERRQLLAADAADLNLHWPGVAQVLLVHRQRRIKGKASVEICCGITSRDAGRATADTLLTFTREHWGIENRLHYVRDVTLGEDACRVRSGAAPHFLAVCRNLVVGLVRDAGWTNCAAALRRYAARPHEALALIRGSPEH